MPKRHNGFAIFQIIYFHNFAVPDWLRIVQKELPRVLRNSVESDREGPDFDQKTFRNFEKGTFQCGLRHVPLHIEIRNPSRF